MDSLVKNLGEIDFKHLSQEFDSEVLDLVKQKRFYPYEYVSSFEKFIEKLLDKNEFYSSISSRFLLKMWCFIVSSCIWNI